MANGHTYEKWQELGYQVKRGENAAYIYYGKKIYEREQVIKIKKSGYKNHCWNCEEDISSDFNEQCHCGMYICSNCGMCFCDQ